jgi:hypothetical protein
LWETIFAIVAVKPSFSQHPECTKVANKQQTSKMDPLEQVNDGKTNSNFYRKLTGKDDIPHDDEVFLHHL